LNILTGEIEAALLPDSICTMANKTKTLTKNRGEKRNADASKDNRLNFFQKGNSVRIKDEPDHNSHTGLTGL